MHQHHIELIAHRIKPAKSGIHCLEQPSLRIAVAGKLTQGVRPFDVRAPRRLQLHTEQSIKAWVRWHVLGAIAGLV